MNYPLYRARCLDRECGLQHAAYDDGTTPDESCTRCGDELTVYKNLLVGDGVGFKWNPRWGVEDRQFTRIDKERKG